MKPIVILMLFRAFFGFQNNPFNVVITQEPLLAASTVDSSRLHISNNSSLKRLPSILHDLKIALTESSFEQKELLNENGVNIDLRDAACKTFDTSASVSYWPEDTVFHLNINRFNRQASDRAIAVTLIHEIMHCILLDIDKRGRSGDKHALSIIQHFNKKINNPSPGICNPFFDLMNKTDEGQHELMYLLFFPDMVSLLERFAEIHKHAFLQHKTAELLMWSGLQTTSGFQNLSFEEKNQIQLSIIEEKGISVTFLDL
jgi:hypothetical protein